MGDCEVCEAAPATVEVVLFPTDVDRLFPMMGRWQGDVEGWPSSTACESCAAITAPACRAIAELAAPVLVLVTCDVYLGVAREALRRSR